MKILSSGNPGFFDRETPDLARYSIRDSDFVIHTICDNVWSPYKEFHILNYCKNNKDAIGTLAIFMHFKNIWNSDHVYTKKEY